MHRLLTKGISYVRLLLQVTILLITVQYNDFFPLFHRLVVVEVFYNIVFCNAKKKKERKNCCNISKSLPHNIIFLDTQPHLILVPHDSSFS